MLTNSPFPPFSEFMLCWGRWTWPLNRCQPQEALAIFPAFPGPSRVAKAVTPEARLPGLDSKRHHMLTGTSKRVA